LCSGLGCLNPAIGQCGDNGSGRMNGVHHSGFYGFNNIDRNKKIEI
jgi:hypothetical protein